MAQGHLEIGGESGLIPRALGIPEAARKAMVPYALERVLPQVMHEYCLLLPEGQAASV